METEERNDQNEEGNADQGSGERPDSPEEATTPPGNPEIDEEKVEKAKEEADATKPY